MKLKIGLALAWQNDGRHANWIGDAGVAECWAKYLRRRDDVESVTIFGMKTCYAPDTDCIIHFHHWLRLHPTAKNILYMQNCWSPGCDVPGFVGMIHTGTADVFNVVKHRFDGYLFPCDGLRAACGVEGDVVPFATDAEEFTYQPDDRFKGGLYFVGNDIRGDEANERYLVPALKHGLRIFGGPYRDPRLQAVNGGKLPQEDLPKLYSSAAVVLNVTHPEWRKYSLVNQRLYDINACGGTVVSDYFDRGNDEDEMVNFAELMTDGYVDMARCIDFCKRFPITDEDRDANRDHILRHHTYEHRAASVVEYVKELL
jgi:hypothetical protein